MAAAQPTLRDRRRAELREQIVLAALRLFAERGFSEVTVEEIAQQAGVSLSTLFRHITCKDDLLAEAVRTGRAQIVANFQQRPAAESAAMALAHAILSRTEQFADEGATMELWRRAVSSAPARVRRAALLDEDERRRLIALVSARLGAGDELAGGELAAGVLVQTMLAAAEYAYEYWLSQPAGPGLHQLTQRALELASGCTWAARG
jgi:AcrR family transcriptional regulator